MTFRLASFLRRAWRLAEAQWALMTGTPEKALGPLRDPLLAGSPQAQALRERAIDRLCARAAMRAGEGRDGSVLRLLSLVEVENMDRARDWRARLLREPEQPEEREEGLGKLLAEMRAAESDRDPKRLAQQWRAGQPRRGAAPDRGEPSGSEGPARGAPLGEQPGGEQPEGEPVESREATQAGESASPGASRDPIRFHMAVDDGGEFLVVSGTRVSLGHSSAGEADIPVLADIESIHATFVWGESFHTGPTWKIEPAQKARIHIDGARVRESHPLCDGDIVELAPHLAFRFRLPEAASASALLELLGGAEADGAVRVLLFARQAAGRVRIGAQRTRHLPVAGLEYEVSMTLSDMGLEVACEGGVRFNTNTTESDAAVACTIPLPLAGRVEVIANARPSRRTPFGIALHPVQSR